MKRTFAVAVVTVLVTASGCGSQQSSSPQDSAGPPNGSGGNGGASSSSGSSGGGVSAGSSSSGGGGTSSGGPASSGGPGSGGGSSSSSGGGVGSSSSSSGGGGGADAGRPASGSSSGGGSSGGSSSGAVTDGGGVIVQLGDGGVGVENSGASCTVPALPTFASLPTNAKLPDPFKSMAGTEITQKSQWTCRRAEISAELQQFELGTKPPAPTSTTGTLTGNSLVVNVTNAGKSISFTATITKPTGGKAPFPALIAIGGTSLNTTTLSQKGVAVVNFPNDDLGAQTDGTSRGKGKFFDLYGANAPAGAMMAWAWGVSRLIDVLEQTPAANIDLTRLAVSGCSRNGKGALVAGAFDERIGLTIPQESGSGGAGSWRVSDSIEAAPGGNTQTLQEIIGENVWFSTAFNQFSGKTTKTPFDHHMLEAMVAPRALLVIENNIDWLGPLSTFTDSVAAHAIWQALGIPDHMALSQVGGHNHCQFPASEQPDVDAFVDKFLVGGGTASTSFLKTTEGFTYNQTMWQDWTVPTLQ